MPDRLDRRGHHTSAQSVTVTICLAGVAAAAAAARTDRPELKGVRPL
jgi:hypothetical protein